jgi:spore germination cell wall hydrolase CwlJ-like protein
LRRVGLLHRDLRLLAALVGQDAGLDDRRVQLAVAGVHLVALLHHVLPLAACLVARLPGARAGAAAEGAPPTDRRQRGRRRWRRRRVRGLTAGADAAPRGGRGALEAGGGQRGE